jgi:hypothetical protein
LLVTRREFRFQFVCFIEMIFNGALVAAGSVMPAAMASSTAYWIKGLSTTGNISFGLALVAGKKRVPNPATGNTALVIFLCMMGIVVLRIGMKISPKKTGTSGQRTPNYWTYGFSYRFDFIKQRLRKRSENFQVRP